MKNFFRRVIECCKVMLVFYAMCILLGALIGLMLINYVFGREDDFEIY